MKNKGAKPKCKKKGALGAFGCDLTEYLESSGQDVPVVLKCCAEFIETNGVVDGIYRLSGITSNIQKLRQEFGSDQNPDLTKEVYLQDIHCVGSLCKLYFRELPNPLLTYELYKKFTEAVSCFAEREQLARIQNVIQELPPCHYRTLEYLSKHLTNIASFSSMTNMHTRNLALVWAPNLLRSKDIEATGCNGDAAFLEVRVQQVVIEFILNHVDEIFNSDAKHICREKDDCKAIMKCMTLPSMSTPMKLVSLEEAQARSLAATHPARKERRENSLPEIGPVPGTFFHTVIDLPDNKRKLSTKSKKWKSIFNLGRSGADSKSKLSRNGSVFVRGQKMSEKATIRPAKSMDSLCSLPAEGEEEKMSRFKRSVASGGFFIPVLKSRNAGTGSTYDLSKQDNEWEPDGLARAIGGREISEDKANFISPQARPPPEQLKVFRVGEDSESEQTSPKMRRMFYAANDGSTKSNFPGSLFPVEASPRHQRKAMNISEPFAVSVPLRVSAVISSNSTPCRAPSKEKHFLSSLEELLSPELEEASTAEPVEDGSIALVESAQSPINDQNEKEEATEPNNVSASSVKNSEVLMTEVHESLKTGESLEESATIHSPEESPSPTKTSVVEPKNELNVKPNGIMEVMLLEGSQMKNSVIKEAAHVDQSFPTMPVNDDLNSLVEPLWPEIQQELKIIESEEEILAVTSNVEKSNEAPSPGLDFDASHGAISSSIHPENNNVLTKEGSVDTTVYVMEMKEEAKDLGSLQTDEAQNNTKIDCTADLSKLEDSSAETAAPKSLHAAMDSRSDSALCKEEKLPEQTHQVEASDEEKIPKLAERSSDPVGTDCTSSIPQPSPQKTNHSVLAETWGQVKKDLLRIRSRGTRDIKDLNLGLSREESLQQKACVHSRARRSSNKEEDMTRRDAVRTFDLMEPWEDHQWVTSPLHSPKLKGIQEKKVQEFFPTRTGVMRELAQRPEFSRSLSLDSKDKRMTQWTVKKALVRKTEGVLNKSGAVVEDMKPPLQHHNNLVEVSRESSKLKESLGVLTNHSSAGSNKMEHATRCSESAAKQKVTENEPSDMRHTQPSLHPTPVDSMPSPNKPEEICKLQKTADVSILNQEILPKESHPGSATEEPSKPKTRPSSLNLDSVITEGDFFKFDNQPGGLPSDTKEPNALTPTNLLPSGSSKTMDHSKVGSWTPPFNTQDLDYMAISHALSGRRNSAPVSVSAVRTSFMIKMCQAKAVPVIPPKVQYTQIPQPLQTQNMESTLPALDREQADSSLSSRQTINSAKNHTDATKSPWAEKKAQAEKENSDPTAGDSVSSQNTAFTLSPEVSLSDHNSSLDAPVMRRKRISEGEATGESPLSAKLERPAGFSKPSYRSRPGRPQSLILFSPPFPFMDHPSSLDSRTLLSPIKSPSHTNSQDSVCSELSSTPRTPDGVILRNKMTIPKSGQRLETSTSCFYQPQRRSVILDNRSSRVIE